MWTTRDAIPVAPESSETGSPVPGHPDSRSQARRSELHDAVEAFQAGIERDRQFQVIFESFYRPLQRFFARKGLATDACLDLTQETLVGIYRGLEAYRPEARFETWVYKIATTTYLKSLRARATSKRSGREVPVEDSAATVEPAMAVDGGQLDALVHDEQREALRDAVRELPDQMRKCLTLRIYHELSYRDIATALRVSIETVKAHLHQSKKKLAERLYADGRRRAEEDP